MALVALKNIFRPTRCSHLNSILSRFYSVYEPDYLEALKPKIPLYPPLSIQIRGYDFPIVEKFQGFVQKLGDELDIDVETSYSMPPKEMRIKRYKPKSELLDCEYQLYLYERVFKVSKLSATSLPILVRVMEAAMPMGIIFNIENYDPEKEKRRFVPDKELLDLKDELEDVKNPKK